MELYYSFSILIVLCAIFSYLNARFLKLPATIGVMVIALMVSIGLIATESLFPKTLARFSNLLNSIDFSDILMGAMLVQAGYTAINAVVKAELYPSHVRALYRA